MHGSSLRPSTWQKGYLETHLNTKTNCCISVILKIIISRYTYIPVTQFGTMPNINIKANPIVIKLIQTDALYLLKSNVITISAEVICLSYRKYDKTRFGCRPSSHRECKTNFITTDLRVSSVTKAPAAYTAANLSVIRIHYTIPKNVVLIIPFTNWTAH